MDNIEAVFELSLALDVLSFLMSEKFVFPRDQLLTYVNEEVFH
jgi:hypothetical protein